MISKVKLEIFTLKLLIYIPFVCVSLIVGVLFNRFIESILLICFFSAIRTAFPTTFHILKSDGLCFVFSAVQFSIVIPNTIPLSISLFGVVLSSLFIGCLSYYIQVFIDLKIFYKKHTEFNLDNPTKEQVVDICKALHYNQNKIDLAVMFFVDKLSNYEVWEYLQDKNQDITVETVTKYKYRMKKDIEKFTTK